VKSITRTGRTRTTAKARGAFVANDLKKNRNKIGQYNNSKRSTITGFFFFTKNDGNRKTNSNKSSFLDNRNQQKKDEHKETGNKKKSQTGWCFFTNPFENMLVKLDHFPKSGCTATMTETAA